MPTVNLAFIRKRRRDLDLTQEQMAECLHMPRTVYNRRESGQVNFKAVEMPLLANKLGVEIEQLYN
ncbi:XRE family transcriptional regulator [Limosilactobacillus fermentum]|uniref:helix-turn-helix domain-containing protein n=1 Tax=Limosilactobacillus fermentum TaxID=1613 RepID=UPI000D2F77DB|nr:XRE family transcriptional regulator [Limosilactobacillus fermentum]QAR23017.1 XRE family transcriptional regulator [Limosilactobacillus fermentum]QAR24748.1 XRE family transcriptional regulator [Limosilactobacillus fermentum]